MIKTKMTAQIITALLTINASLNLAQDFDIVVSNEERRGKKEIPPFNEILGFNSKNMYVDYRVEAFPQLGVAYGIYDKNTLEKKSEIYYGKDYYKEHKPYKVYGQGYYVINRPAYKNNYKVLLEDKCYLFFEDKHIDKEASIYVETFDSDFKLTNKLTKIYSTQNNKSVEPNFVILYNENLKQILVGAELSRSKKENIRLEYKLMDENLKFINSGQVDFPVTSEAHNVISYEFLDNGLICAYYKVEAEEKKSKISYYYFITIINPKTNSFKTFELKDGNRYFIDIKPKNYNDKIIILSTYCEVAEKKDEVIDKGFALIEIDKETLNSNSIKYISLKNEFIMNTLKKSEYFKDIFENAKKANEFFNETFMWNLKIAKIFPSDNNSVVVETNYSFSYELKKSNFSGIYSDYYDVIYFRINLNGSIEWAKSISRSSKMQSGLYEDNVKTYQLNNNKILSYIPGSSNNFAPDGKIKDKDLINLLHFFIIDIKTGTIEPFKVKVPNIDPKDEKTMSRFYFDKSTNSIYTIFSTTLGKEINFVKLSFKK
ncbi:MAG TPA: hypothetical protein PK995_04050 [Bacteroidia bacterium]|nr:hypothetical protein [Bacteroidia bacterium]